MPAPTASLPSFPLAADVEPFVLYADEALLVVEKPAGLLSVPGRGEDKQDCMMARLMRRYPDARIVHRLDHDTSGLLVVARDAGTHRELSRQFHDREVEKVYVALALGEVAGDSGRIDLPLRYDPPTKPRHVVDRQDGQSALTEWRVLARGPGFTRVALVPHTGRTHQLRVHMQALGHPLLGDTLYAPAECCPPGSRLCLHAEVLGFVHPVHGGRLRFERPAPFRLHTDLLTKDASCADAALSSAP
jgi:tRNA pseudouridine32 synthase/23S rRNA pseudouridine746 synthase